MHLSTTRFGDLEIDDQSILTFTQPIIGFQEYRRFVILPGPAGGVVFWLQSVESGELAFILMDPHQVMPDYTITVSKFELSELAVNTAEELDAYTVVVVPEDPAKIRTNLRAPILVNPKHRLAKQTILEKSNYPVQFFLAQAQQEAEEPQEV